jgi:hydroxyacyl-ACP dehydratase HTD2-like protein with hotdog domain
LPYEEFVGRAETRTDTLSPTALEAMAATLDRDAVPQALPPLWHWTLFQTWVRPAEIGPDGHPRRGGFLPPAHDLPRRMYAGGRLSFAATIRANDAVARTSTITRVEQKTGASGTLLFVTVRHVISGPAGEAVTEEHDIVYRGLQGPAARATQPFADPPGAFGRSVTPDPVLLFRYSALTGNGHRIHYDQPYVTGIEGYPGLIVHGPLQATLLSELVLARHPGATLRSFSFRALRPVFDTHPFRLVGTEAAGVSTLCTVDHTGQVCMQAEAELA